MRRPSDGGEVKPEAAGAVDAAASSSGAPLPGDLQGKFESSLGADLSGVRVHTGEASAEASEAVGARAYTTGNDIHFGAGEYDPSSASGQTLLAHEVAHTVQQRGGAETPQYKLEVSSPGDASEVEADQAADAMVAGKPAAVASAGPAIMRNALQSKPPAMATDAKMLRHIMADAHTLAQQLGASQAKANLEQALAALGLGKIAAEALADTYKEAQAEVNTEAIKAKEAEIAMKALEHGLVKAAASKAIGLVFPKISAPLVARATGFAGVIIGKLAGAVTDAATDAAAGAVADHVSGKPQTASDTKLPSMDLLVEVANAKELWAHTEAVAKKALDLADIGGKATTLVSGLQLNAMALEHQDTVPTNTSSGDLGENKPKTLAQLQAGLERLRAAKDAADQCAAAATVLLGEAQSMNAQLNAVVAATTKDIAKSQIRAAAGMVEDQTVSTGGTVNKADITTQWNRMIGEVVTATTDCKPNGQCKPPFYPAKTDPAAPTPQVNAVVGDGFGELPTGHRARVIAVLDAGWYSVTLLVQPIGGPAAPSWNGEECT